MVFAAEKDLQSILALPLTGIQTVLAEKLLAYNFSDADRDQLLAELEKSISPAEKKTCLKEQQKIEDTLASGKLAAQPNFSTPELQLLWAIHLTHLATHSKTPIQETPLWTELLQSDDAERELRRHAFYIARDAINPDTRLKWGDPGSMFYSDPVNNQINIDFLMSLVGGMDATRSIIFHEIGHSKLSRGFSPKMVEIQKKLDDFSKRQDQPTPDEYAEINVLNAEWQLRNAIWQEGENNVVNRYGINTGERIDQMMPPEDKLHLDRALNIVETTIAGAAKQKIPAKDEPQARFDNLSRAIRLALYKNNEYFPDDAKGWESVGVNPDWVQALPKSKKGKLLPAADSFKELLELCGGNDGLEHLQPSTVDRMKGTAWLEAVTVDKSEKRNAIMEDIWDRFAEPLVRPLLEQVRQNAKQEMQQKKQQQKQLQGQGQGQGQGKGQGTGQSQGRSQGEGQGQGKGQGSSVNVKGVGEMPSVGVPPKTPQEAKNPSKGDDKESQSQDADGGTNQGQGKPNDNEPSDKQAGAGKSDGDKKSKQGKQAGARGASDKKKSGQQEADQESSGEDGDEKDAGGQDASAGKSTDDKKDGDGQKADDDGTQGKTIASLLQEIDNLDRAKLDTSAEDGKGGKSQEMVSVPAPSTHGEAGGSNFEDAPPKVGDWSDYNSAVKETATTIRQARTLLVHIQEKQSTITRQPTYKRSVLPDDNDMSRLDDAANTRLGIKILSGESVAEDDARRFEVDEEKKTPASIDVVIAIDGSDSMYWDQSRSGRSWTHSPIDAGINIACVLNEAAKKPRNHRSKDNEGDIRIWGMVWGNKPPSMLMKPGDDPQKVGKKIAGLKQSRGWGTELAPAIKHMTKELADHKERDGSLPTGFTHQIIISDGDIGDPAAAAIRVDELLTNNKRTTFDVVVIQDGQTEMDKVVKTMQKKHGEGRVKLVHCNNPDQAQSSILSLLRERMLATGHSTAVPYENKRREFEKAYEAMR